MCLSIRYWYTLVACVILTVSPDVMDVGSEYFVVDLSCVYRLYSLYVRLTNRATACSVVSTSSTLGISHALQNEKLWKFTQE